MLHYTPYIFPLTDFIELSIIISCTNSIIIYPDLEQIPTTENRYQHHPWNAHISHSTKQKLLSKIQEIMYKWSLALSVHLPFFVLKFQYLIAINCRRSAFRHARAALS